jgi:drug/metabolite transporter (DMT)-like permease
MRNRLIGCLLGGVFGLCAATLLQDRLGLSPAMTYVGGVVTGVALGCVASILFDVFTGNPATIPVSSRD